MGHTLDAIAPHVETQLADLRSAIVKAACDMLVLLASEHGAEIAPFVPRVLPQLLRNLYVSIRVISKSSEEATCHHATKSPTMRCRHCNLMIPPRDAGIAVPRMCTCIHCW